jgi:hypothetical protein
MLGTEARDSHCLLLCWYHVFVAQPGMVATIWGSANQVQQLHLLLWPMKFLVLMVMLVRYINSQCHMC